MHKLKAYVFVFGIVFISANVGRAADDSWRKPLSNRNRFPLALLFLSMNPERATVLDKGERAFSLDFDYSNILAPQSSSQESLELDMEYLSATIGFRAGLGKGFELGAALPLFVIYGGFLDGFISAYHEAFGLPNTPRGDTPNDLFRYRYTIGEQVVLERSKPVQAIGDLTLQVKKTLLDRNQNELALRTAFKAPTGSLENLSGSGAADFGLGLAASRVGQRFGGYFNINYLVLGEPDGFQAKNTLSFMGAFEYRFKTHLAMLVQYEQLEPFIKSSLPILDQSARQLVLGLRWRGSDRYYFEWRFAEDLTTTAPDFTFGFRMVIHWNRAGQPPIKE
jgi:hypothetical protein